MNTGKQSESLRPHREVISKESPFSDNWPSELTSERMLLLLRRRKVHSAAKPQPIGSLRYDPKFPRGLRAIWTMVVQRIARNPRAASRGRLAVRAEREPSSVRSGNEYEKTVGKLGPASHRKVISKEGPLSDKLAE